MGPFLEGSGQDGTMFPIAIVLEVGILCLCNGQSLKEGREVNDMTQHMTSMTAM